MANKNMNAKITLPNTFTPASERTNISAEDNIITAMSKSAKYFNDLQDVAFTGSYNDLDDKPNIPNVINNLTSDSTTDALAAAQGKELKRIIDVSAIEVISGETPLPYTSLLENALTNYQVYGTVAGIGTETSGTEPEGYKITLTNTSGTNSQNYDLFIGDSKLVNEEYLDYAEQKIYKRNPAGLFYLSKFTKYDNEGRVIYFLSWDIIDRPLITGAGVLVLRAPAQTITHSTPDVNVIDAQQSVQQGYGMTARFRDLGEGANIRTFVTINGEYVYGPSLHMTYNEVIAAPDETIYVDRPPVNTPIDPPLPFPAITTYDNDNTLDSIEALERIDIKGLVRIYGGYLPLSGGTLTGDLNFSSGKGIAASAITTMTGYSQPLSTSPIATTDTLNAAVGKLERGLDDKANTSDIPTVNDGTLTIQQNGTTKATFTANQAGNATVDIQTGDAYGIDIYDDTLPIDITARGDNLEDWVIYGNNEPGKNLVNLADVQSITYEGITWTIDATNGIVTASGKMTTSFSIITLISPTNLSQYNGCYLSCDTQNVFYANINIRDSISYAILVQAKSNESVLIDNIPTTNCYVQLAIEGRIGDVVDNLIFKPMIRAANTTPDFDPYHLGVGQLNSAGTGYELPIITKQTGKADITTNIYLGTSPLTEGQSLSKAQATTKDIPTYNGECVIDTSYPNKPKMEIIPTDSAINIINWLRQTSATIGTINSTLEEVL